MKNYITLYADEFDCDTWEGYCCAAGVPKSAVTITIQFDESDVDYEDGYATEYEVPIEVAARIETAKDLNDFYAYTERFTESITYTWPESEQFRIDELVNEICYQPGHYDAENIKRILGREDI